MCIFIGSVPNAFPIPHRRHILLLFLLISTSGCSTSLMHNSASYKKASEIAEIQKKSDIGAVIREERAIQEEVLAHEISVVDKFATARRNHALMNLMTSSSKKLSDNLDKRIYKRIVKLVGPNLPKLQNLQITDLVTPATSCGVGLESLTPHDIRGKPNYPNHAAWIQALDMTLLAACRQELREATEIYKGGTGLDAPICPYEGVLSGYNDLKDEKKKQLVKEFKVTHPTSGRTGTQINQIIAYAYSNFRDKCMLVREHEKAARALVFGCLGKACGAGIGDDAEIVGIGGLFTDARRKTEIAKANLLADEQNAKQAKDDYKIALDTYTQAAKKHTSTPSDATRNAMKDASEKLGAALEAIQKAGGDYGKAIAASEQITKINQIMSAAATGEYDIDAIKKACTPSGDNCGLAQATAVAANLPTLIDQLNDIATLAKVPPLSGLLLEKSRLLALKKRAEKAVKRRQRQIAILESNQRAMLKELQLLNRSDNLRNEAGVMTNKQFIDPATNARKKEFMLRALAKYLQTFTGPKRQVHSNEYRLIALEHESALDYSESSLDIWNSAIEIPVVTLLDYHESGLKPEDIVELLKVLGILGIAVGVN